MKIRFISLFLILALVIAMSEPAMAAPDLYWSLQANYNKAMSTETTDDDIPACEAIMDYYKNLDSADACYRVIAPLLNVARIYEERGQFQDALRCYKFYKKAYQALDSLTDDNCAEALRFADAFIAQYAFIEPTVYTAAYYPADVPYFGAQAEPRVGTYTGMCNAYNDGVSNAYLLYVHFPTETTSSFSYMLPRTSDRYLLEIAWNTPEHTIEFFRDIANGDYDSYIKENLTYIDSLTNCDIIIRFAAEVNEWEANTTYAKNGRLDEFKDAYISAFRHLYRMKQRYAPNAALAYSPNDVSNMYVSPLDFYPGDDFVDWIGLSSYLNLAPNAQGTWGSMSDAYYSCGKYENQIIKMSEIIQLFGEKKPILISESGFCYSSTNSPQTMAHAMEKMEFFLAYANMVFPQVKAIYYFNTTINGNSYMIFDASQEPLNALSNIYVDGISQNIPMSSLKSGDPQGYTKLTTINEVRDDLMLYVFASYPGNPTMNVRYTWDGVTIEETSQMPYNTIISKEHLTPGNHTLNVTTSCKNTVYSLDYDVYVASDGTVTASTKNDVHTSETETTATMETTVAEPETSAATTETATTTDTTQSVDTQDVNMEAEVSTSPAETLAAVEEIPETTDTTDTIGEPETSTAEESESYEDSTDAEDTSEDTKEKSETTADTIPIEIEITPEISTKTENDTSEVANATKDPVKSEETSASTNSGDMPAGTIIIIGVVAELSIVAAAVMILKKKK